MTNSAAFFDLDRTLMAGSSAYYFGRAAYREGLIAFPQLLAYTGQALRFKLLGATDEQSEALREHILEMVAGTSADSFAHLAPVVVEDLLARVRPEAQALVDMHQEAGRDVYIISASPVEIVGELARALRMTGGLGTESETVDGVYTGRLASPFLYGEAKAERIRKLAAEKGYDLATCYSYSDSASDLPMMCVVGHPVAVNPDRALEAVAHRRGWPIVEFNRQAKHVAKLATVGTVMVAGSTGGYALGRRQGLHAAARRLEQAQRLGRWVPARRFR